MLVKGSARGGPGNLARHLEADENERVTVIGIQGLAARGLAGALREMDALGATLKTSRTLYHMSINPEPGKDREMSGADWAYAERAALKKMGLENQPHIVIEHEKLGKDGELRRHRHIVAARADLEHGRAIRCDHNYRKHEELARELERHLGHERVQGAHAEREGKPRPERTPSHAEMQQEKRGAVSREEAKKLITGLWQATDSGTALKAALEADRWVLARGDKTTAKGQAYLIAIDPHGGTHELARRVDGAKAAAVHARMADLDPASLPSVAQAKEIQRERQHRLGADRQAGQAMQAAHTGARGRYDAVRATERDISRSQAEGGRYDDLRAAEPAPEIARQFAAGTARATEPAAPAWDRDAASRDADERIIDAAVAATEKARRRPEAEAGREASHPPQEPAHAPPKVERELSGTAADIRMAWSMTRTPGDLKDALAARGIGLAMVSAEEAQASQRAAAFAQELGNFAPRRREGEIVAVDRRGHVYRLDERTTGQGPLDVQGRLNGLDHAALADVTATRAAMRAAGLEAWKQEQRAERERARDPNWVEQRIADCAHRAGIDGALVRVDGAGQRVDRLAALADQLRPDGQRQTEGRRVTGRAAFAARLEEAGIAIARVTDADAKALEALRADERNERLAASVNGAARRDRHFAELAAGELAAVTRGGDVYRINLDKCGEARSHLPDALPGVVETRARFEVERGREGEFWARRRTDIFEAQQLRAAERESRADTRAMSRDAAELARTADATADLATHAGGSVLGRAGKIFASIIGWLADSIAPPPPPTRDQAERMARSADERQEAQQQQQARAAEQEFMLREIERSRQSADRRPTEAPTAADLYGTPKPGGQERDTDRERDRGLEL